MSKTLQTRIQLKHDTEANWVTAGNNGFIPLAGEVIIYDDLQKIKVGNGQKNINELDFMTMNPTELSNIIPTFTVVGTTLVVGNAATIPAAEDYSF